MHKNDQPIKTMPVVILSFIFLEQAHAGLIHFKPVMEQNGPYKLKGAYCEANPHRRNINEVDYASGTSR